MDGGNMETIGVTILLLGAQIVLAIMFVMCMRFSTRQVARVNESKVIPPRIKDDSPPYTFSSLKDGW